jgi:hypothetical protein
LAPSSDYQPWVWKERRSGIDRGIAGISDSPSAATTPIIATSSGENDPGLFDVNLRDERWLPFEGQGAISNWNLILDPRDNNFDLSSVTDVVLHIRYTARSGGDANIVRTKLLSDNERSVLISVRNTFGDAYYSFFNPTDDTAKEQPLVLPLTNAVFPFSNIGTPRMKSVTVIVALTEPLSSDLKNALKTLAINGTFGLTGSAVAVALQAVKGPNGEPVTGPSGAPIAALSSGDLPLAAAPASLTLSIPQATLPAALRTMVGGRARLNPSQTYLKFQLPGAPCAACSNFCVGYPRMARVPPVLLST